MPSEAAQDRKSGLAILLGAFVLATLASPCYGKDREPGRDGPLLLFLFLLSGLYFPLLIAACVRRRRRALSSFVLTLVYSGLLIGAVQLWHHMYGPGIDFGGGRVTVMTFGLCILLVAFGAFMSMALMKAGPPEQPKPDKKPGDFVFREPDFH